MTSNDKKTKSDTAPKSDAPSKDKGIQETAPFPPISDQKKADPKDKGIQETASGPADSGQKKADPSAGYSRGEGQKPVSKAYKDNWNLIFGAKKKR
jgi:hypothetical protein